MTFADLLASADQAVRKNLGGEITYTPGVGDPVAIDGVFDAAFVLLDPQQPGVSSQGPALFVRVEDLPSDPEVDGDATVTINGVEYSPHTVKPDGLGGLYLLLHRTEL